MHRRQYLPGSREHKLSRTDLAARNRKLRDDLRDAREDIIQREVQRRKDEAAKPRGIRKVHRASQAHHQYANSAAASQREVLASVARCDPL